MVRYRFGQLSFIDLGNILMIFLHQYRRIEFFRLTMDKENFLRDLVSRDSANWSLNEKCHILTK